MNADERRSKINSIAESVLGCAFKVSNTLGVGFLEKVYENALAVELSRQGLIVQQQYPIEVFYEGVPVGHYVVDLLVEGIVVVELKVVRVLDDVHKAQCLNYLRATGYSLCLLLNFADSRVDVKRIVHNF